MKKISISKSLILMTIGMMAGGIWIWKAGSTLPAQPAPIEINGSSEGFSEKAKMDRKVAAENSMNSSPEPVSVKTENQSGWSSQTRVAIQEFVTLSEKIFLDSQDKMRKSELLMNPEIIQNIGDYLLRVSKEKEEALHDQSLDFLVEALKLGSNEALVQVERVITDPQVEDGQLPLVQRKFLGEIKGELLYQYAALHSNEDGHIEKLLPGPVSQKIWTNVRRVLETNFAESKRELAEMR